jgi:predicted  nucleic acid-binding Zn-ribbon protein
MKAFENNQEIADYLAWLLDTDTELEDENGEKAIQTHYDPGSNELFIMDVLSRKSYKITVQEHGTI